ncbi:hypothetical protein MTO96_028599 [Rhipicephalus appendiculatus]
MKRWRTMHPLMIFLISCRPRIIQNLSLFEQVYPELLHEGVDDGAALREALSSGGPWRTLTLDQKYRSTPQQALKFAFFSFIQLMEYADCTNVRATSKIKEPIRQNVTTSAAAAGLARLSSASPAVTCNLDRAATASTDGGCRSNSSMSFTPGEAYSVKSPSRHLISPSNSAVQWSQAAGPSVRVGNMKWTPRRGPPINPVQLTLRQRPVPAPRKPSLLCPFPGALLEDAWRRSRMMAAEHAERAIVPKNGVPARLHVMTASTLAEARCQSAATAGQRKAAHHQADNALSPPSAATPSSCADVALTPHAGVDASKRVVPIYLRRRRGGHPCRYPLPTGGYCKAAHSNPAPRCANGGGGALSSCSNTTGHLPLPVAHHD